MERQWNLIKAILAHAECMGNGDLDASSSNKRLYT